MPHSSVALHKPHQPGGEARLQRLHGRLTDEPNPSSAAGGKAGRVRLRRLLPAPALHGADDAVAVGRRPDEVSAGELHLVRGKVGR